MPSGLHLTKSARKGPPVTNLPERRQRPEGRNWQSLVQTLPSPPPYTSHFFTDSLPQSGEANFDPPAFHLAGTTFDGFLLSVLFELSHIPLVEAAVSTTLSPTIGWNGSAWLPQLKRCYLSPQERSRRSASQLFAATTCPGSPLADEQSTLRQPSPKRPRATSRHLQRPHLLLA